MNINVSSLYGRQHNKALVQIVVPDKLGEHHDNDHIVMMEVSEARDLAMNILAAAEASVSDAFLIHFLIKEGIASSHKDRAAAVLISEFREFRKEKYPDV